VTLPAREGTAADPATPRTPFACDTHAHVMDSRFPFAADRSYTPGDATVSMVRRHLDRLALDRVVLVQPSVYGTGTAALESAIEELGTDKARGVATVSSDATARTVARLAALGVVGLRLNAPTEKLDGNALAERFTALLGLARRHELSLNLHATPEQISALSPLIRQAAVPVVFEHFALLTPHHRAVPGAVDRICDLVAGGAWLKLTGITKVTAGPDGDRGLAALVRKLAAAAPGRLVWGSDWPHTMPGPGRDARPPDEVEPFQGLDDRALLRDSLAAVADPALRREILVDNPAALYGFA
jgi:predicted TIM-barrel fold metal-dependent hydrolase